MNLFGSLLRWWRTRQEKTERLIRRSRALNEHQAMLTEATGNFLADRYAGRWEGNRDA